MRKFLKENQKKQRYLKRIPVKSARGTIFILTKEIDWIVAAGGHCLELHVGRETHLIRENLLYLETILDPQMFARIHRSTIVNLDRIKSLHPLFYGDHIIILKNGQELNLSRTYYKKVMLQIIN